MLGEELRLADLVNLEEWQKIQDSFAEVLDTTLQAVSLDGEPLSKVSHPNRLCNEILPKSPRYSDFCGICLLKKALRERIDIKKTTNFTCPLGCDLFVIPIKAVSDKIVAYIFVGPLILKGRKPQSVYARYAKRLEVDLDELMDAFIEISTSTYNKINSVTKSIEFIFSHMVQAEYHKKRLGEIAPKIAEMDPAFSRYYEEKILGALLNACTIALDADSGSVMTLDKKTDTLRIKVSSKLDDNIVSNTTLKVGEGIAGLAAAKSQPIILPKDEKKKDLSGKMKRKYIKSSMVVPFSKKNKPDLYGVINLNILRKGKDFSDRDTALVNELINLASVALVPLNPENHTQKK
jgi:ligand-binding sensor protein